MAEAAVKEPEKKDTNLSEDEKEIVIPAMTTITKAKRWHVWGHRNSGAL